MTQVTETNNKLLYVNVKINFVLSYLKYNVKTNNTARGGCQKREFF